MHGGTNVFISSADNSFHTVAFNFCPGLRCRADSECKSWRWTHPDVFLNGDLYVGPLDVPVNYDHTFSTAMHCEKIQKKSTVCKRDQLGRPRCEFETVCKHRRCELLYSASWPTPPPPGQDPGRDPIVQQGIPREPQQYREEKFFEMTPWMRSRGYVSGERNCYRQVLGQNRGCYHRDTTYKDLKTRGKKVIIRPGEVEDWGYVGNWGDCAKECYDKNLGTNVEARGFCKYWTWASFSCKDCIPGGCWLIYIEADVWYERKPERNQPKPTRRIGFISGTVDCQDITYLVDNARYIRTSQNLITVSQNGPNFSPCPAVEEASLRQNCPVQVVPGFRLDYFPSSSKFLIQFYSSDHFSGGALNQATLMTAPRFPWNSSAKTTA